MYQAARRGRTVFGLEFAAEQPSNFACHLSIYLHSHWSVAPSRWVQEMLQKDSVLTQDQTGISGLPGQHAEHNTTVADTSAQLMREGFLDIIAV